MTDFISLTYPVVDPDGSELHEGVYRQNEVGVWSGGATAYITLLGYIVQIWSALFHRGWAGKRIPVQRITGDYTFDASEDAPQGDGKEWRVSSVAISIDSYPPSGNVIFGSPKQIMAGYFSWFRSTLQQDGLDWQIIPDSGGSGFQTSGYFGVNLDQPFGPLAEAKQPFNTSRFSNLSSTGEQPGTGGVAPPGVWDLQLHQQPALYIVGVQSWGSEPQVKKSKRIEVGISNTVQWHYPLQWLNWERMWMEAPDPNVNGFTLKLKPGVVASVNIGLTVRDPHVSYGGGESSGAAFNPMKGGAI